MPIIVVKYGYMMGLCIYRLYGYMMGLYTYELYMVIWWDYICRYNITGWWLSHLPLWKIWVRQLGWWHSQYMESHKVMFQTTNKVIIHISRLYIDIFLEVKSTAVWMVWENKVLRRSDPKWGSERSKQSMIFNCPLVGQPTIPTTMRWALNDSYVGLWRG